MSSEISLAIPSSPNSMTVFMSGDSLYSHVEGTVNQKIVDARYRHLTYMQYAPSASPVIQTLASSHVASNMSSLFSRIGILGQVISVPHTIMTTFMGNSSHKSKSASIVAKVSGVLSFSKEVTSLAKLVCKSALKAISRLGSALTVVSVPFTGIKTYKSYKEIEATNKLIHNLNLSTPPLFTKKNFLDFASEFFYSKEQSETQYLELNPTSYSALTENVDYQTILDFTKLFVKARSDEKFTASDINKAQKLCSEIKSYLKYATYQTGAISGFFSTLSAYNLGTLAIPAKYLAASMTAAVGAKLIVGTALINGSAYLVYNGSQYFMDN